MFITGKARPHNLAVERGSQKAALFGSLRASAALTALCLLLVGCYETFPTIRSASVTHWKDGKPQGFAQKLTPEQVTKLFAWLQNHRWDWHPVVATYARSILVSVTHSDGTTSSANLMQKFLIVGQYQRSLSESESQELHSIVGEEWRLAAVKALP